MNRTRRLAAILAADVAGYSRLIGVDEEGTLNRLRAIRAELIDPKIAEHRGRIVKTTGDGLLVEFASVVDALRCASQFQGQMAERNTEIPSDMRIEFRVGVHQGDIVVDGDDIFGDGVNVAARLESLADPGGICVSARVQEDAAGRLDLAFRDLGEQHLHNIARPVRVYAIDAKPPPLSSAGKSANPTPRISVVVLPFVSLSPDPEQEYFADAVTDDLTTDLSRIADSFVIARTTAFTYKGKAVDIRQVARELGVRYVLEGSVRRLGERVQVNVQLIDGETGSHIWADRFDTDRRDLAEAQSEITGRLASTLNAELVRDAGRRIERERAADPDVRDLVMRARALFLTTYAAKQARDLCEQALALDPGLVADGLSDTTRQDEDRAERLVLEALERDPNHPRGNAVMGQLRRVQGRVAEAQAALERAIALDHNNAWAYRQLGQVMLYQGKPDAAIPHLEKTISLDPYASNLFLAYTTLAICKVFLGHIDEGVTLLRRAKALNPRHWPSRSRLAGALGLQGDTDEAKSEIVELLKLKPDANSIARLRVISVAMGQGDPRYQAPMEKAFYAGLRRAGFPEE